MGTSRENIVLIPRHIHNILADALSRSNKLVSTEWTLHMYVVQAVRYLWGSPTIYLFATKINNRLPQYMSPLPDPKALAVDALSVSWDGMNAYAFPPTPLIQAVLNKVMTDKVRLCLIAPCWPSQAWFPTLLELLTDHPKTCKRLPEWDHLLWHHRVSLPQLPFFLQASRLETIGCILRAKKFSEDAVSCLTLAQRRGTIDSYQLKWSVYQTWCGKEGVHPVFPTLPKLVDFLNHLLKKGKFQYQPLKVINQL
jgi:hypothetical protein